MSFTAIALILGVLVIIDNGETLISFYQNTLKIATEIQDQDDKIGQETRLVRRSIELLYKQPQLYHLLRDDFKKITYFCCQKHHHKQRFSRSHVDIYQDLLVFTSVEAPTSFTKFLPDAVAPIISTVKNFIDALPTSSQCSSDHFHKI